MNKRILKSESMAMAASMVRAECLGKLSKRCNGQKTISTSVVEEYLEGIEDKLIDYAYQMAKLVKEVQE